MNHPNYTNYDYLDDQDNITSSLISNSTFHDSYIDSKNTTYLAENFSSIKDAYNLRRFASLKTI